MDHVVVNTWWPEAGGTGHKRALCLVAAGAGLLTGGAFLLCMPELPQERHKWSRGDLHTHYKQKNNRRLSNLTHSACAQRLLDMPNVGLELEPEPDPEPELQPELEPQPMSSSQISPSSDAELKRQASTSPTGQLGPQKTVAGCPALTPGSPELTPKSPQISPVSPSSPILPAPLSRGVSWGSAAFDRARQTTSSELRKAFDCMSQSVSKDLSKLGDTGTSGKKVLSKDDFIHVCTEQLDLDLSASEIKRLFDQLDESKTGTLNFAQFCQAVNRSSFFKTIASNYNSPVRSPLVQHTPDFRDSCQPLTLLAATVFGVAHTTADCFLCG